MPPSPHKDYKTVFKTTLKVGEGENLVYLKKLFFCFLLLTKTTFQFTLLMSINDQMYLSHTIKIFIIINLIKCCLQLVLK